MRALLLASCLLFACSSDDSTTSTSPGVAATQGHIDQYCTSGCAALKKCSSATDETTCVNKCKNDMAAVGPKLRADYIVANTDCTKTASCDKLSDCDDTAEATLSPTAVCSTFCDEVIKKNIECKSGETDKSGCLNRLKIFADATFDAGRQCLTKSCTDYGACLLTAFGR